jgi:hypothetical protein
VNVYPARGVDLNTGRKRNDRLVIVTDPDAGEVRVRWNLARDEVWRCETCGPMQGAECPHTFSAGLLLAEDLLGLTRVPELTIEREAV